ncbi:helix-turn-helix transcriptional regulator [Aceticella autotrophica]|uniref:Helix-turn-helix transcriptional regulator n=1 Tax=Aceticella autotrophica TaxID=2755338 RepID=A0A975AW79_9THEO|nr:helix-turn-helix transcriptional regulator [Aceticella autotrophica]QSZ27616.1 helix-turn-helix transcriptional regulator [Aceticella autotrophica]
MDTIGIYLRKLRIQQNLSLNDVFDLTGITTTRLNRIERGQVKEPSPIVLKKLSDLYNADLINLYKMAGYLEVKNINERVFPFQNYEVLDNEECAYIQQTIDFFVKKNHR